MISVNEVIAINKKITKENFAVKSTGGIESAIQSSYQTFDGKYLIEDKIDRIINVFTHLVTTQYFKDGNKRTAFQTLLVLLEQEGKSIDIPNKDIINLVYGVANHKISDISKIREFLKI